MEGTIEQVVHNRAGEDLTSSPQEPPSQRMSDNSVEFNIARSYGMIEDIVENPNDMDAQDMMAAPQEVLQLLPSGNGQLEGESKSKIVDEGTFGTMAHDEDLLNVSGFGILDIGILESVYVEHKVEEVDGSGSAVAHHLEKSSSLLPNEEPLLHAGSGIILLPYTPISVGMSAPPKMSEHIYFYLSGWLLTRKKVR